MTPRDANVAQFAQRRADRQRREHQVLKDGLSAATDALYEWVGHDQDVRVAIVAMHGDPHAGAENQPEAGHSVPVEAQFISLDLARPLTDAQRRHLAIETMRAASEALFQEMTIGVGLADFIEDLSAAAEAGDEESAALFELIMEALNRRRAGKP